MLANWFGYQTDYTLFLVGVYPAVQRSFRCPDPFGERGLFLVGAFFKLIVDRLTNPFQPFQYIGFGFRTKFLTDFQPIE
ncbi:hypothetical protein D3C76_1585720 [compost metagenome]